MTWTPPPALVEKVAQRIVRGRMLRGVHAALAHFDMQKFEELVAGLWKEQSAQADEQRANYRADAVEALTASGMADLVGLLERMTTGMRNVGELYGFGPLLDEASALLGKIEGGN